MSADSEWLCRAVFHVLFRTGNGISFHQYSHYNPNLSVVSLRWYPHSISIPVIFPSFPHDHPIFIPSLSHNFLILIPSCSHRHSIIFSQCFPSHLYNIPMIWVRPKMVYSPKWPSQMDKSQINQYILGYTTIIPSWPHHLPTIIPLFFPSFFPSYPYNTPMISSGDDRFPMFLPGTEL